MKVFLLLVLFLLIAGAGVGGYYLFQKSKKATCNQWSRACNADADCSTVGKGSYTCQNGCCACKDSKMWNGHDCSGP